MKKVLGTRLLTTAAILVAITALTAQPALAKDQVSTPSDNGSTVTVELPDKLYKPGDPDVPTRLKVRFDIKPGDRLIEKNYSHGSMANETSGYLPLISGQYVPVPTKEDPRPIYVHGSLRNSAGKEDSIVESIRTQDIWDWYIPYVWFEYDRQKDRIRVDYKADDYTMDAEWDRSTGYSGFSHVICNGIRYDVPDPGSRYLDTDFELPFTPEENREYNIEVYDMVGNSCSDKIYSWEIDKTGPTIDTPNISTEWVSASNGLPINLNIRDINSISKVEYKINEVKVIE